MPFQVRIPLTLQNLKQQEEPQGIFVTPDEQDTAEKPEDIIALARDEAAMIIKEAEYEARRIMDDAYTEAKEKAVVMEEEAWQKGYAEGLAAAQKQYEETISEAEAIKESAIVKHDEVLAGIETEIIDLVLDVAKKVIGTETALNKENLIYLVKQAIDGCSNKSSLILKVCAEDYEFLAGNRDRLMEMTEGIGELEIKKDISLKPGACILETPFGNMDAGAQTKLKKIEEAFRELVYTQP